MIFKEELDSYPALKKGIRRACLYTHFEAAYIDVANMGISLYFNNFLNEDNIKAIVKWIAPVFHKHNPQIKVNNEWGISIISF